MNDEKMNKRIKLEKEERERERERERELTGKESD